MCVCACVHAWCLQVSLYVCEFVCLRYVCVCLPHVICTVLCCCCLCMCVSQGFACLEKFCVYGCVA